MSRARVAIVLALVAGVAVLATVVLAVLTLAPDDEPGAAPPLTVTDPASGATLEVPADGWRVRSADQRISYDGVSVAGPAVLDEGYCEARPEGSFRALAGFTRQPFDAWVAALGDEAPDPSSRRVELAGGVPAAVQWVVLPGGGGPCAASGIEVAMVGAGDVRAVVVADSGAAGTPTHGEVERILLTLELP